MVPSLLRRTSPPSDTAVERFLDRYRRAFNVDKTPRQRLSTEPLLQHYGIETRWLDVVDSLQHALFFATHELCDSPQVPGRKTYAPSLREYGFVYLLDVGHARPVTRQRERVVGYWKTSTNCLLADLRALKPSNALRPHAQHGLLVRSINSADLWSHLVARVAVPANEARRWTAAPSLERDALFPPPIWDLIYGTLTSTKMADLLQDEARRGRPWGDILRFDFVRE
jgi:hypothetical protein